MENEAVEVTGKGELAYSKRQLDRQVKKKNENPSVGLLLCASKNDEVVEYAMSRSMHSISYNYLIKVFCRKNCRSW